MGNISKFYDRGLSLYEEQGQNEYYCECCFMVIDWINGIQLVEYCFLCLGCFEFIFFVEWGSLCDFGFD